eukprot:scaffold57411_cov65-Phaeocystis_antarctica.AAC.6
MEAANTAPPPAHLTDLTSCESPLRRPAPPPPTSRHPGDDSDSTLRMLGHEGLGALREGSQVVQRGLQLLAPLGVLGDVGDALGEVHGLGAGGVGHVLIHVELDAALEQGQQRLVGLVLHRRHLAWAVGREARQTSEHRGEHSIALRPRLRCRLALE